MENNSVLNNSSIFSLWPNKFSYPCPYSYYKKLPKERHFLALKKPPFVIHLCFTKYYNYSFIISMADLMQIKCFSQSIDKFPK